jgi:hypothetical protein
MSPAVAQSNDITLSLGGIPSQSRSFRSPSAGSVQISADVSLGANYGHRLLDAECHSRVTAKGSSDRASLALGSAGRRIRSVRAIRQTVKWPENSTSKFLSRGAFDFGGGLDYQLFRLFGLRGEVRDFVSGNPNLNVALSSSTQHNIVASGGISVRF